MNGYDNPVLISRGTRTTTHTDKHGRQVTTVELIVERKWLSPIRPWRPTGDVEENEE